MPNENLEVITDLLVRVSGRTRWKIEDAWAATGKLPPRLIIKGEEAASDIYKEIEIPEMLRKISPHKGYLDGSLETLAWGDAVIGLLDGGHGALRKGPASTRKARAALCFKEAHEIVLQRIKRLLSTRAAKWEAKGSIMTIAFGSNRLRAPEYKYVTDEKTGGVVLDMLGNPLKEKITRYGQVGMMEQTWEKVCAINPKWEYAKFVYVTRFPEVGPFSTQPMEFCVFKEHEMEARGLTSLAQRFSPDLLKELDDTFGEEHASRAIRLGLIVNHTSWSEDMGGDFDGDLIFSRLFKFWEEPIVRRHEIDMLPYPGKFRAAIDFLKKLEEKSSKIGLTPELGNYYADHRSGSGGDSKIGMFTVCMWWMMFSLMSESKMEMPQAVRSVLYEAYPLVEALMDRRKGVNPVLIANVEAYIQVASQMLRKAVQNGHPAAVIVCQKSHKPIRLMLEQFNDLYELYDAMWGPAKALKDEQVEKEAQSLAEKYISDDPFEDGEGLNAVKEALREQD